MEASLSQVKGKVVFVGDASVGKTSLIYHYNQTKGNPLPTVGANSVPCTVTIEGKTVSLNIWDTAGQENFQCLVPMFARCSNAAIIVYDSTNKQSFDNIALWYKYAIEESNVPNVIIVSNKSDLESVITADDIHSMKEKYNCPLFFTSAITGSNVDILFREIAEIVDKEQSKDANRAVDQPINFSNNLDSDRKKKCC